MKQKKAIAMSFNWIFAIIVGIFILFLAIYATVKIIGTGEYKISTETAAKLVGFLNPMGTGLASGKSYTINFKKPTRTYYECESFGSFGRNTIGFSEESFGKFGEKGADISTKKYVFAENIVEGKTINLFSKPFNMPFKIDDVIVIIGEDYCFYQSPNEIQDEINRLDIKNIHFSDELNNCTGTRVCFGTNECDINVYGLCEDYNCNSRYDSGKVLKQGEVLYYDEGLLYGAIFSSPEIYECNVKRLMKRFDKLSMLYNDKIKIIELKDCSSNIGSDLTELNELAKNLENSDDLSVLFQKAREIDIKNDIAGCKLY